MQGCRQSDPRARGEPCPPPNLQLLPVCVSYSVNTAGTLTPESLGEGVPNTTFLRRGCDWLWIVAAHTVLGGVAQALETYS